MSNLAELLIMSGAAGLATGFGGFLDLIKRLRGKNAGFPDGSSGWDYDHTRAHGFLLHHMFVTNLLFERGTTMRLRFVLTIGLVFIWL